MNLPPIVLFSNSTPCITRTHLLVYLGGPGPLLGDPPLPGVRVEDFFRIPLQYLNHLNNIGLQCCSQEISVLIQHQTHLAPLSTDPNCITQAESKKCKKQFPEFSFEGKLSPIKSSPILHYWTRPVNWPPRTSVPFDQIN